MNGFTKTGFVFLLAGSSADSQESIWTDAPLEIDHWTIEDGLPQDSINAIAETPDGFLWLGTWGGLVRFDGLDFHVFDLSNTPELFTNRILELTVDRHGALWIGTLGEGVLRYADGRFQHFTATDGAPRGEVRWIVEAEGGVFWADPREAVRFDGERIESVPREPVEALLAASPRVFFHRRSVEVRSAPGIDLPPMEFLQSLERTLGDDLYAFHVDRHGQIWAGSRKQGLFRIRPAAWERIEHGLDDRGTFRVVPDAEGGVWIAPNRNEGLLRSVDGEIIAHVLGDPDTPMVNTLGILAARDGTIWARHDRYATALRGEGFEVLDLGVVGLNTSPMAEDADGAIWCGMNRSVCRFPPQARGPEDVRWFGPEEGLDTTKRITALGATRDGSIWAGTLDTVFRWDGHRFQRFDGAHGLPRGYVRAIVETSDGSLWFGTYGGGLARFTDEGFVRYGVADGLPDPAISCILEDAEGYLWMNSNQGAFTVRLDALREYEPGRSPELPTRLIRSGEANGSGGCLAGERVFLPTMKGLVSIDTERALAKHATPPVAVVELHEVDPQRDLRVRYTSPDLFDPAGLRFEHRLVGYDDEWVAAGARREAFYTKLPPGDFAFEVVAVDSSGQRSVPARLELSIAPFFYETLWFRMLGVVVVLGIAFGAYRLRLQAVTARNLALQAEVHERRLAEDALQQSQRVLRTLSRRLLTVQDEERRGIARELHDDVTQRLAALSIQAEVLEGRMGPLSPADRQQARDLARLAQRLAVDVQQLSRRLHPSSLKELGLVRAIRSECDTFSKRAGLSVRLEANEVPAHLPEEVTLCAYRIVQESLHNVEKHSRAAEAEVRLGVDDGALSVDVIDAGRGFEVDAENGAGIGLASMGERADAVGGKLAVESRPGKGTAVRLRIPVREGTP